jgi:hypothetical protein
MPWQGLSPRVANTAYDYGPSLRGRTYAGAGMNLDIYGLGAATRQATLQPLPPQFCIPLTSIGMTFRVLRIRFDWALAHMFEWCSRFSCDSRKVLPMLVL